MNWRLTKQTLAAATLIMMAGNILGRMLGFAREAVFASFFGTTALLDTFILAFTLPELIAWVMFTALPTALIPAINEERSKSGGRDGDRFWSGFIWSGGSFAALSIVIFLFRDSLLLWMAPGLTADQAALGGRLIALLSPYVFLRGMEAYFRSWCFARKHFVAPATSTLIINVAVIGAVFLFYDRWQIETLAIGWVVGATILFLYNGFFAFRLIRPGFRFRLDRPWVRLVFSTLVGIVAIESIAVTYPFVDRLLAARFLGDGPISALRYAGVLSSLPAAVFVAAFNLAAFPWIADYSSADQGAKLRTLYEKSFRLMTFFMSMVALGVAIFAQDIVRVTLQRGEFDADSLALTTSPLVWYALGMLFQALASFQMRFYFVRRALLRLGIILGGAVVVKLLLSWLLIGPMEHHGLALASSSAYLLACVVLTIDLGRHLSIKATDLLGSFLGKTVLSLAIVTVVWFTAKTVWPVDPTDSLGWLFLRLSAIGLVGFGSYVGAGLLLRLPEAGRVFTLFQSEKETIK